jgi:uncharacterized protein
MRLVLDTDPRIYTIRQYVDGQILVGNQVLRGPCIISTAHLVADWAAVSPAALDAATLAPLLELQPSIILLGVLARHAPPPRSLVSALQRRGIAIETMNLGAACRTYNVLVQDGRPVAAGLFPV